MTAEDHGDSHARRGRRLVVGLAAATFGLCALAAIALVLPLRSGLLGLALVFELQLFAAVLLVGAPVAAIARSRLLGLALVLSLVVAIGRFGSEVVSLPAGGPATLTVLTWNLERGARSGEEAATTLRAADADVIALQELEPAVAGAIAADHDLQARFPYRYLVPDEDVLGLGVLSRYPIGGARASSDPAFIQLVVDTPEGAVTLIDAHPLPLLLGPGLVLPITFNPATRDAQLGRIRAAANDALSNGERVLIVGDFNTSPTEPGYATLAAGLRDAHVEVGQGPGWTWRPSPLAFLPLAVLRIDLQLSGGGIDPVSTRTDCSHTGDHCQLYGRYRVR